jgi:hypothetical protein
MAQCLEEAPATRAFAAGHRVACHAVTDDGRLRDPSELPLLRDAASAEVTR